MNSIYVYSTESDNFFVKHLTQIEKLNPSIQVFYKIGSKANIDSNKICSMDASNVSAVFVRSYSYVPQYNKVENTFYWVHPKYSVESLEDKRIAMDGNSERQLLKMIVPPKFCNDIAAFSKPCTDIKNAALCSCYERICLK